MEMPVMVGVILVIVFLVGFSEWFYGLAGGIKSLVLDDVLYLYRIVGVSLVSILFMAGIFMAIAYVNECPNEEREGVFAGLQCEKYLSIRAATEQVFQGDNKIVDKSLD
jgi:hypothetical protein